MIEIKKLTKIYHTKDEASLALNNISITFPKKGFVALTGQSGSGKTTLLNILGGFLPFEEGEMYIFGKDALTFQKEDWQDYQRRYIGFIFQDYGLIEDYTVLDNVLVSLVILGLNKEEALERAHKYLKLVELDDLCRQKAKNLSSGQKQRLSIARTIAKEPKIILCDEPTANLDPDNSIQIMRILAEISKNTLVIVSTHNYEDAKGYANYFVRLYNGEIISYEEKNPLTDDNVNEPIEREAKGFDLYKLYLRNRFSRLIINNLFVMIVTILLVIMLTVFIYNLDTSQAMKTQSDLFNNLNSNELLIMNNDGSQIDEDKLQQLLKIKHVTAYDTYGLGSDTSYYYREGIDYRYEVKINKVDTISGPIEYNTYELNKFAKNLFIKSYAGHISEANLQAGKLPEDVLDVVAPSGYNVGDTIKVFIDNFAAIGNNALELEFNVCGVLKDSDDNLYFSDSFMRQMDFINYVTYEKAFTFYSKYYKSLVQKTAQFTVIPLYLGNILELAEDEIIMSSNAKDYFGGTWPTRYNYIGIMAPNYFTDRSVTVTFDSEKASDNIGQKFVLVSKEIYDKYDVNYQHKYARIYVDEYPYLKDVIEEIANLGYDVLSPFTASSSSFDESKMKRRSTSLIISISAIFVLYIIYYFYFIIVDKRKRKEQMVMKAQGASIKNFDVINNLDILFSTTVSLLLGFIASMIITNNISYLKEAYKFVRFYHVLLIIGLLLAFDLLIMFMIKNKLKKRMM